MLVQAEAKKTGASKTPPPHIDHFKRPEERLFTKSEKEHVTLLFGGLTLRHDTLIKAAMEGLGYRLKNIPVPEKADFQAGKEYGNNGQCNPTYFTTGALVNYLKRLRDEEGISTEDIVKNYVSVTAGACGPCRFGMYEAEFRLALRNSGFDGFRVLLFQQKGGVGQSKEDEGLELNVEFAIALLNAIMIGDLINELAYQIRPYEVVPGQVDRTFEKINVLMCDSLRSGHESGQKAAFIPKLLAKCLSFLAPAKMLEQPFAQLHSTRYTSVLAECRRLIEEEIEVDYTRCKPICKITGEFWAQTTEGDGNYNMFRFLESQGAEVLIEPVTTWLNYLLGQERARLEDRFSIHKRNTAIQRIKESIENYKRRASLFVAKKIVNREYNRIRAALGNTTHAQICQLELQRMGHPYYNRKAEGGEGHLEVAKNIYYSTKNLAHMVMSLKPFGCMPSSQSDGAQAAVIAHYPDMIFIPIETSGEGDVNAHSRAQMALGEAKAKSKVEFKACLAKTGYTLEEIRAYCAAHPELRSPLLRFPKQEGIVGKAASFVVHVGKRMDQDEAVFSRALDKQSDLAAVSR